MKIYTFKVTQEDIKNGKRGEGRTCPIALCLKRTGREWFVGDTYISSPKKFLALPTKARNFIFKFDDGLPVKPFSFKLKI